MKASVVCAGTTVSLPPCTACPVATGSASRAGSMHSKRPCRAVAKRCVVSSCGGFMQCLRWQNDPDPSRLWSQTMNLTCLDAECNVRVDAYTWRTMGSKQVRLHAHNMPQHCHSALMHCVVFCCVAGGGSLQSLQGCCAGTSTTQHALLSRQRLQGVR